MESLSLDYSSKPEFYFERPRVEIQSLLPKFANRVLDIGCGSGSTLKWIKSQNMCKETTGIELVEQAANHAKQVADHVYIGNIEDGYSFLQDKKFDLILMLDVLEHLVNPWSVLKNVVINNLAPKGIIIACIPNVRYYNVILPLIFRKSWQYQDTGVLDRTHLRFFSRNSAEQLMTSSGLNILNVLKNPIDFSSKQKAINFISGGFFQDILTQQYIFKAAVDS